MTPRTVVLHYHLFKNAGTSVDQMLKSHFGTGWVTAEFPMNADNNTAAVEEWIANTPEAHAFSSHTMVGPLPQIDGVEIIPVILLRDPLARIASAYRFEARQDADTWGANLAKEHDFEGYVRARLARQNDRQCRNFQVSRLSTLCPGPASEYTRALNALTLLNVHGVVGRVEDFDAFTEALTARLKPRFPDFVPEAIRANVSQKKSKDETPDDVAALLAEANTEDITLLEQVDNLRKPVAVASADPGRPVVTAGFDDEVRSGRVPMQAEGRPQMKAAVLAAGKGTRIHDITGGAPKSLLPLGDKTLIGQSLRQFQEAGITDLVIATGYRRNEIEDYVRQEWPGQVEFVFNPHFDSTNVLYSFWLMMPYLAGSDFMFLHADTVFSDAVLNTVMAHPSGAPLVFAVDDHPCEEEEMKVQIADGHVTLVTKQMPSQDAAGEFLGLARISASALPGLRAHAERLFEEGTFNAFFELAVQRGIDEDGLKVEVADVTGMPWREVDFPEDYEAARGFFG